MKRRKVALEHRPLSSGVLYHPSQSERRLDAAARAVGIRREPATAPQFSDVVFFNGPTTPGHKFVVHVGGSTFTYVARKGTTPEVMKREFTKWLNEELRR